jgi:hypothetical protein
MNLTVVKEEFRVRVKTKELLLLLLLLFPISNLLEFSEDRSHVFTSGLQVVGVLLGVVWIGSKVGNKNRTEIPETWFILAIGVLFLAAAIPLSVNPTVSTYTLVRYYLPFTFLILIVTDVLRTTEDRDRALGALILGVNIAVLTSLIQWKWDHPFYDSNRLYSVMGGFGTAVEYYLLSIFLTTFLLPKSRYWLLTLILPTLGLLWTDSALGFLVLILFLPLLLPLSPKLPLPLRSTLSSKLLFYLLILVLTYPILLLTNSPIRYDLQTRLVREPSIVIASKGDGVGILGASRTTYWIEDIRAFTGQRVLIGYGLGTAGRVIEERRPLLFDDTHNTFFTLLLEGGLIGGGILLGAAIFLIKKLREVKARHLLLLLTALGILSFFNDFSLNKELWLVLALAISHVHWEEREEQVVG